MKNKSYKNTTSIDHNSFKVKRPRFTNNSKSIDAFNERTSSYSEILSTENSNKNHKENLNSNLDIDYDNEPLPLLDTHLNIINELDSAEFQYSNLNTIETSFNNLNLAQNEEKSFFLADFDSESTKLFLPSIPEDNPLLFLNLDSNTNSSYDYNCSFDIQFENTRSSNIYETNIDDNQNKKLKKMQAKLEKQMVACEKRLKKQREREAKKILKTSMGKRIKTKPKNEKIFDTFSSMSLSDNSSNANQLFPKNSNSSLTNDLDEFFKLNHFSKNKNYRSNTYRKQFSKDVKIRQSKAYESNSFDFNEFNQNYSFLNNENFSIQEFNPVYNENQNFSFSILEPSSEDCSIKKVQSFYNNQFTSSIQQNNFNENINYQIQDDFPNMDFSIAADYTEVNACDAQDLIFSNFDFEFCNQNVNIDFDPL